MNEVINNALTQESPTKVMSLLGVALFSLGFMAVTAMSDASFSGSYSKLPDPFSMEYVVAGIDNAAANYAYFLDQNLFTPAAATYQVYSDNIAWVSDNGGLTYALGLEFDSSSSAIQSGKVAGASTYNYEYASSRDSGVLDLIYSAIME